MTLYLSIIATIISISSFIVAFRNFRQSQRLEFLQRRDQLMLRIADLNAKMSDSRLISARFQIVLINKETSSVVNEAHAEELKTQIAQIKAVRRKMEVAANLWEETIHNLQSICSNLTIKTDPAVVEEQIANVQIALRDVVRTNGVFLATLHTLETTDPMLRASVEKTYERKLRQAESRLEQSKKETDPSSPGSGPA